MTDGRAFYWSVLRLSTPRKRFVLTAAATAFAAAATTTTTMLPFSAISPSQAFCIDSYNTSSLMFATAARPNFVSIILQLRDNCQLLLLLQQRFSLRSTNKKSLKLGQGTFVRLASSCLSAIIGFGATGEGGEGGDHRPGQCCCVRRPCSEHASRA